MKTKILATLLIISILLCSLVPTMAESDKYDLGNFGWKRVDSKGRGSLVFQKAPRGKSMSGHKFYTGDQIYVNLYYRESGYGIAYENGEFGYVDASYIDWGDNYDYTDEDTDHSVWGLEYIGDRYIVNCDEWVSLRERPDSSSRRLMKVPLGAKVTNVYSTNQGFYLCTYNGTEGYIMKKYLSANKPQVKSDDRFNLSNFDYRRVYSNGRGSLVFQKSPKGAFMSGYKFHDGDDIYVNLYWRSQGYAIAYYNGVFGYVDASYIDWSDEYC